MARWILNTLGLLFVLLTLGVLALALHDGIEWASETPPAWLQFFGTVGSIWAVQFIATSEARERRAEQRRSLSELRKAALAMATAFRSTVVYRLELASSPDNWELVRDETSIAETSVHYDMLARFPVERLADVEMIEAYMDVVSTARAMHLLLLRKHTGTLQVSASLARGMLEAELKVYLEELDKRIAALTRATR